MASNNLARCAEKTAFVVGYTGEVGKVLVEELLKKRIFRQVRLIGRRSITFDDPLYANIEQKVVDFDNLDKDKDAFTGCEYGFCCLGTTRKAAGSDERFIKIDHDYVVASAKTAHEQGCKRFAVITAQNASKDSRFLYPKTKGLVELHVSEIPFEKVTIARPSFIRTTRLESSTRGKFILALMKPVAWCKPSYATIPTDKVAKAMIYSMCSDSGGQQQRVDAMNNDKLHYVADNYYDTLFPKENKN